MSFQNYLLHRKFSSNNHLHPNPSRRFNNIQFQPNLKFTLNPNVQYKKFPNQQLLPHIEKSTSLKIITLFSLNTLFFVALSSCGIAAVFHKETGFRVFYLNQARNHKITSLTLNKSQNHLLMISLMDSGEPMSLNFHYLPLQAIELYYHQCLVSSTTTTSTPSQPSSVPLTENQHFTSSNEGWGTFNSIPTITNTVKTHSPPQIPTLIQIFQRKTAVGSPGFLEFDHANDLILLVSSVEMSVWCLKTYAKLYSHLPILKLPSPSSSHNNISFKPFLKSSILPFNEAENCSDSDEEIAPLFSYQPWMNSIFDCKIVDLKTSHSFGLLIGERSHGKLPLALFLPRSGKIILTFVIQLIRVAGLEYISLVKHFVIFKQKNHPIHIIDISRLDNFNILAKNAMDEALKHPANPQLIQPFFPIPYCNEKILSCRLGLFSNNLLDQIRILIKDRKFSSSHPAEFYHSFLKKLSMTDLADQPPEEKSKVFDSFLKIFTAEKSFQDELETFAHFEKMTIDRMEPSPLGKNYGLFSLLTSWFPLPTVVEYSVGPKLDDKQEDPIIDTRSQLRSTYFNPPNVISFIPYSNQTPWNSLTKIPNSHQFFFSPNPGLFFELDLNSFTVQPLSDRHFVSLTPFVPHVYNTSDDQRSMVSYRSGEDSSDGSRIFDSSDSLPIQRSSANILLTDIQTGETQVRISVKQDHTQLVAKFEQEFSLKLGSLAKVVDLPRISQLLYFIPLLGYWFNYTMIQNVGVYKESLSHFIQHIHSLLKDFPQLGLSSKSNSVSKTSVSLDIGKLYNNLVQKPQDSGDSQLSVDNSFLFLSSQSATSSIDIDQKDGLSLEQWLKLLLLKGKSLLSSSKTDFSSCFSKENLFPSWFPKPVFKVACKSNQRINTHIYEVLRLYCHKKFQIIFHQFGKFSLTNSPWTFLYFSCPSTRLMVFDTDDLSKPSIFTPFISGLDMNVEFTPIERFSTFLKAPNVPIRIQMDKENHSEDALLDGTCVYYSNTSNQILLGTKNGVIHSWSHNRNKTPAVEYNQTSVSTRATMNDPHDMIYPESTRHRS